MCEMYKAHVVVCVTLPTFPPDLWKFLFIVMLHFLAHVKDGVVKMGAGRSTHSMPHTVDPSIGAVVIVLYCYP